MSSKYNSLFNKDWLTDKSFSSWIEASANPHQARCRRCCKTFELSNMGRQAVKSHETSAQHNRNSTNCPTQTSVAQFMQPKNVGIKADQDNTATVSTSDAVNESLSVIITSNADTVSVSDNVQESVPATSAAADKRHQSMGQYLCNDSVTKAEVLWLLQIVAKHHSLRS